MTFMKYYIEQFKDVPVLWKIAKKNNSQIGQENTEDEYVQHLVEVFREVKRILKDDSTLWLNLGDSYAGSGKGRNSDCQFPFLTAI